MYDALAEIKTKGKKKMKNQNEIEITGESIESFERVEKISEIILLGKDGGIRRILIDENP